MDDLKGQPAYEIIRRARDNWASADDAWAAMMISLANMVWNSNLHGNGPETWDKK